MYLYAAILIILLLLIMLAVTFIRHNTCRDFIAIARTIRWKQQQLIRNDQNVIPPMCARFVTIEMWGAGGGGAIASMMFNSSAGGIGGGGGGYVRVIRLPVTERDNLSCVVGRGGKGAPAVPGPGTGMSGDDGTDTIVRINGKSILLTAGGGQGGIFDPNATNVPPVSDGGSATVKGITTGIVYFTSNGGATISFNQSANNNIGYGGAAPFGGVGGMQAYWKYPNSPIIAAKNGGFPGGGGGGTTNFVNQFSSRVVPNVDPAGDGANGLIILTWS